MSKAHYTRLISYGSLGEIVEIIEFDRRIAGARRYWKKQMRKFDASVRIKVEHVVKPVHLKTPSRV